LTEEPAGDRDPAGLEVYCGAYEPGMRLADLHIHTRRSDGWWEPGPLAEAAVARGLDAVGITDHDDCRAGFAVADYCARRSLPLRVYPGIEVSARSGKHDVHVLGFEIEDEVAPWQTFGATVEAILKQGGFVVVPHPRASGHGFPTFDQVLELGFPVSVEVFNAGLWDLGRLPGPSRDPNTAARDFYLANQSRLAGPVGGTDAHFRTIGRGMTAYEGELREALGAGTTAAVRRIERERLAPWDVAGYFGGLRRLDRRRSARYGPRPRHCPP
jgi:hypothetical protein